MTFSASGMHSETQEPIGIIAGSGQFPRLVAENARACGLNPVICGFFGNTDPLLEHSAHAFTMVHLGQFGKMLTFLRSHRVRRMCFAGAINKPKAFDIRPDWMAAKIIFSLRGKGDDALLRAIIRAFEKEGFSVVGAAELAPGLRCPAGQLTRLKPSDEAWEDIRYAWPIATVMGNYDIGQSLVVKKGVIVAVECLEGTDVTLRRGGELGGEGCVAIKVFKPGQDHRVDLPSFGLETIRILAECKYQCLAVSAHNTLFFDREAALAEADAHGLSVIALEGESLPEVLK